MHPYWVLPPHIHYLLSTLQKSATAPPTVPPSPVVSLCTSLPTDFPPLPALLPPWESPTSHLPSSAHASPWYASENLCLCHPPYSTSLPKTPKSLIQKSSTTFATALYNIAATLGSPPFLLNISPKLLHTVLSPLVFRLISGQSLSVWSRGLPRYLKFATPSTNTYPYPPYSLNSIYTHLSSISTSLYMSRTSVALLHIYFRLCLSSLAAGICIPKWSHLGSGSGLSCRIYTFDCQCWYMKCSLILFDLSGYLSTGHAASFSTHGKDTLYVSGPPTPASNPLLFDRTIPRVLSMWWKREDAIISPLNSSQLTLVLFRSPKVTPSPLALLLYVNIPRFPQRNPCVNTIDLVLPIFFWSPTLLNILTIASRFFFTHMVLFPAICPLSV